MLGHLTIRDTPSRKLCTIGCLLGAACLVLQTALVVPTSRVRVPSRSEWELPHDRTEVGDIVSQFDL